VYLRIMLGRVVELIAPVVRICVVRRSSRDGSQRYRPLVLRKDGAGQIALSVSRKVDILLIRFPTCALALQQTAQIGCGLVVAAWSKWWVVVCDTQVRPGFRPDVIRQRRMDAHAGVLVIARV